MPRRRSRKTDANASAAAGHSQPIQAIGAHRIAADTAGQERPR